MNLQHIKTSSGEDIVAYVEHNKVQGREIYTLYNPITVYTDPQYGYVARSWLSLSDLNYVNLFGKDILFCNPASVSATSYYNEFMKQFEEHDELSDDDDLDDFEELRDAMLESKNTIKH